MNNLREIQAIKRLSPHRNIVVLEEVLYDPPSGRLALVFELMEGNLYELMKGKSSAYMNTMWKCFHIGNAAELQQSDRRQPLGEGTVKSFMRQIFTSLDHMHGKGVFHRDIKVRIESPFLLVHLRCTPNVSSFCDLQPENILVDKLGRHLKLADFGSCRGIHCKPPFTEYISTRWYRPPECLLTCGMYGMEMDIWGAGCIQFELTALYPLFPGLDEADQIHRIHNILGTPNDGVVAKFRQHAPPNATFTFPPQRGVGLSALLPDADERFLDILSQSVAYDVSQRITSKHALKHPYFADSISFSSGAGRVAKTVAKDKSRVAKNARGLAKVADSASAVVPVQIKAEAPQQGKQRSMVSLLLARVSVCADNLYIIDHIRFYQISHLHVRIIRRCSSKNQWQETKLFIEKEQIRITII